MSDPTFPGGTRSCHSPSGCGVLWAHAAAARSMAACRMASCSSVSVSAPDHTMMVVNWSRYSTCKVAPQLSAHAETRTVRYGGQLVARSALCQTASRSRNTPPVPRVQQHHSRQQVISRLQQESSYTGRTYRCKIVRRCSCEVQLRRDDSHCCRIRAREKSLS
eukprot:COSAG02_NODE_3646_length_6430_cov_5.383036_4_plen_163_part_00